MAQCDNKSVGVIIRDTNGRYAVIKRINFPVSYAFVAGHLDGDSFEDAARKEAEEEAGILITELSPPLLDKAFGNPCKRSPLGHHWKVFEALEWSGTLTAGSDAKEIALLPRDEVRALAEKTDRTAERLGVSLSNLAHSVPAIATDEAFQQDPGLEPVWVIMLRTLNII